MATIFSPSSPQVLRHPEHSPGALLFDNLEAFHLLLDLSAPQKRCALAIHIAQGVGVRAL